MADWPWSYCSLSPLRIPVGQCYGQASTAIRVLIVLRKYPLRITVRDARDHQDKARCWPVMCIYCQCLEHVTAIPIIALLETEYKISIWYNAVRCRKAIAQRLRAVDLAANFLFAPWFTEIARSTSVSSTQQHGIVPAHSCICPRNQHGSSTDVTRLYWLYNIRQISKILVLPFFFFRFISSPFFPFCLFYSRSYLLIPCILLHFYFLFSPL